MVDEKSQAEVETERIKGLAQIKELCYETARELGLNLTDVRWVTDIVVEPGHNYDLTITAGTGDVVVSISCVEIEDFPGKVGTENTVAKIRAALRRIQ